MKSTQIVLLLLAITNLARAADITPAEVFRKLGERSERFETFAIEWTSSEWYAAGSKSLPSRQPQTGTDDPLPAQDVEFAGRASLTVSGSSLLSRRHAYDWIPHKRRFVARDFVEFTNGKDSLLFASPIAAGEPSLATLKQGAPSHIINLNHIAAVILALRPVHASIGRYDKHSAWNVSPSSGVIEGAACLILERVSHSYSRDPSSFDNVTRLWIDPDMDYAIRRSTTGTPGHVLDQLDIQYRRDASFGWLPDGWVQQTFSRADPLQLIRQFNARVESARVNQHFDVDESPISYLRPESWVNDEVSGTQWLLRPDGSRRIVTADELARNVSYQQLIATEAGESGNALLTNTERQWLWPLLIASGTCVLFLTLLAAFPLRWSARNSRQSP